MVIGTRDDPVKQPLFDDNPMIESGLEPEKGPLRLYNWADYIYTRVLKDFEEEFGVEVELTTFYNLEEATRKAEDRQGQPSTSSSPRPRSSPSSWRGNCCSP